MKKVTGTNVDNHNISTTYSTYVYRDGDICEEVTEAINIFKAFAPGHDIHNIAINCSGRKVVCGKVAEALTITVN